MTKEQEHKEFLEMLKSLGFVPKNVAHLVALDSLKKTYGIND